MGFERRDDVLGANGDVVVAEDGKALGGMELFEEFGADTGGFVGDGEGERAAADEVSGDEDELRVEGVDLLDSATEKPGLGVLREVEVGDLDEAEADEGVGEMADGEGAVGDFELVAGVEVGVEAEAGGGKADGQEEVSTGGVWGQAVGEAPVWRSRDSRQRRARRQRHRLFYRVEGVGGQGKLRTKVEWTDARTGTATTGEGSSGRGWG